MTRSPLRWLAIPAVLILLALAGLALSTEDRSEFEERAQADDGTDDGRSQDNGSQGDQQTDGQSGQSGQSGDSQQSGQGQPADGEPGDGERGDGQQGEGGSGQGEGQGDRIVIQTGEGDVVVELDENGRPARIVSGESTESVGEGRTFTPDPDGNVVGVRVTDDGRLEPVERGDLQDDDLVTRPGPDGGVEITRPDGSRVQLEPTEGGQIDATEIGQDGTPSELTPDGGDVVVQPGSDLPPGVEIDPDSEPLVVGTDSGPVRLDLDPNGDLVADQPSNEAGIAIEDLEDLEEGAIRVNEDGSLELVPADETGPDDTVLVPNGDGIDLVRPDGSRVEFRPDGDGGGITATEVDPSGEETELTPNPDGSVTLEDGTTVGPIDFADDDGVMEQLIEQTSNLPWPWVFAGIGLLALLSIAVAVYLYRNRPPDAFHHMQLVPTDKFEEFLTTLANDPDPTRAIRLAFNTAERGLAGVPMRRADETPFEWHHRVETIRPELAKPLAPICDLFALARFAPGHATEEDRALMLTSLRELYETAHQGAKGRYAGGSADDGFNTPFAGSGSIR